MSEPAATLAVDGDPNNLQDCIVRIDGNLPIVFDRWPDDPRYATVRPLRVGDTVTLATPVDPDTEYMVSVHAFPFAEATVARIDSQSGRNVWLVTVENVEALK